MPGLVSVGFLALTIIVVVSAPSAARLIEQVAVSVSGRPSIPTAVDPLVASGETVLVDVYSELVFDLQGQRADGLGDTQLNARLERPDVSDASRLEQAEPGDCGFCSAISAFWYSS